MRPFSVTSSTVFALIVPVFTSLTAPPQASPPQQGTILHPINILDYEASMGLQRHDSNHLSVLDPQNQSQLVYGSHGDNGQLLLANMTLYAPDGLPIVLLERFEELNVSVKCHDDEGTLSLTFGSEDAFDYAKTQWGYVNEADDGKFLFIVNKDGCGPDDQRQSYIVSNITDDTATFTTSLAAQAVPLSDVMGSYELEFGNAIPMPQAQELRDRGLRKDIQNAGQDVDNAGQDVQNAGQDAGNAGKGVQNMTEGNFDKSKSASFPISAGQQDQRTTIFNDPGDGLTIDCTNCFIAGSLEVTGHISVQNFKLEDLILTASPNSFLATLELEAIMTASYGSDSLGFTRDLPTVPFPGLGITILGIMNIGTTLKYSVGGNCSFSGAATVDFGLEATVPDSAKVVADYNNHGGSKASGFSGGQLTPNFGIKNGSASVTLSAFSQLGIQFGVNLFKFGTMDVAVTVKLPEVSATLTAKDDEQGACSHEAEASKTGIQLDSSINIEVDLGMNAELGDKGPSWSKTLFSDTMPLYSHCYPLNIPGLPSAANVTRAPMLPSTLSVSAFSSGVSAFPTPSLGLGRRWALNSSSVLSLPTSYPSISSPQTKSSSPVGEPISGALFDLGMELIGELDEYLTSSRAEPSSTAPSTTSTNFESKSVSTVATSSTSSKVGVSSILSSPTSEGSRMTSTLTTSPISSRSESLSITLSTGSPSLKTVSTTTHASSPTTPKSSTMTSTFTTSSKTSRSESSSMRFSSTSTILKTTSVRTLATSTKSSRSEPSSTLPSTTLSSSAHDSSRSTKVDATFTKSSRIEPSSIPSSMTLSLSTPEPSHSTKVDATATDSEVTSTTLTPSKSASKEHSHVLAPVPTPASMSLQPELGTKTAIKQPEASPSPVEPSPKKPQILPPPKQGGTSQPKSDTGPHKSSLTPHKKSKPPSH